MSALQKKNFEEALGEIEILREKLSLVTEENEKSKELLDQREKNQLKVNQKIQEQFSNIVRKNQEVDYLLKITNLEIVENDLRKLITKFLEESAMLVWCDASFAFKCDFKNEELNPISHFILNSDSTLQDSNQEIFLKKKFYFFNSYLFINKNTYVTNIQEYSNQLPSEYRDLRYCYLLPLEIDDQEKIIIVLGFNYATELDERTLNLLQTGMAQLKNILQKYKSKRQLLENYKKIKDIKSQLIQSEKMASIGTISAGIAHEINNPLSFLLTNTEVLKEYLVKIFKHLKECEDQINIDKDSKAYQEINYILSDTPALMDESLEGIRRIREIVNGLRTFSRADEGDIKVFDVNECIDSSLKLVSNELKHKCKIIKCLNSKEKIRGSDGQLIQVFTNLLVNSAQAINNYGEIIIESYEEDQFVCITFEDNGSGISKDNMNNLFTPFFTTKPTGKGTGLGLSISYGIIKKHGGNISVESQLGIGTKFKIMIPICKGAV